jgi:U3 small nucleolar RNA-associated protein 6
LSWNIADGDDWSNTFVQTFDLLQAIYLPNPHQQQQQVDEQKNKLPRFDKAVKETISSTTTKGFPLTWQDIPKLFHRLNRQDQDSWCVETVTHDIPQNPSRTRSTSCSSLTEPTTQQQRPLTPETFWSNNEQPKRAYCSFVVQHDRAAYQETLEQLPLQEVCKTTTPASTTTVTKQLIYEPCLWFFFGWNTPPPPPRLHQTNNHNDDDHHHHDLQGRPDHTDSISHDGTWHYELSGCKRWYLRPTVKLLEHWKELQSNDASSLTSTSIPNLLDLETWLQEPETAPTMCVECNEGDVIVVNTRLWWHRTVLPRQTVPSVSYARDFRVQDDSTTCRNCVGMKDDDDPQPQEKSLPVSMTNVDGLYATNDIDEGTILFTEKDMPDCELHRSVDAWNCQVVELDDGTSAVVSSRPIVAGEFFCVPESEDEEDGDVICEEIDDDDDDELDE